ncbi:MAG: glycosyltransferase family 2 protein [Patescibacteria group bacterium]
MQEVENVQPLITTVIPTYRRPKLLKRAVLSVLNQTYPHIKICVYDNASGDNTKAVVDELAKQDSRVHYYCRPSNIGGFNNINLGMKQVDTPYFSFLADDDILLPDFYETAMAGFSQYPEAMFSATKTIIIEDKKIKGITFSDYEEKLYSPPDGLIKAADGGTNSWTGSVYKTKAFMSVGLDETLIEGPAEQDFLLRFTAIFPYVVSKSPGAIFVVHSGAESSSRREVDVMDGYMRMIDKIKNNRNISSDTIEIICQKIKRIIVDSLWPGGWIDIKKRNFSRAGRISLSLNKDFGENYKAAVLGFAAQLCERSQFFYYLYIRLNQIRKFFQFGRRGRERQLQAKYGSYLTYLDKYSET